MNLEAARSRDAKRLTMFVIVLAMLATMRVALSLVPVPLSVLPIASVLTTAFFVFVPIVALFRVAGNHWTAKSAAWLLAGGVAAHVGFYLIARFALMDRGLGAAVSHAFAQTGLLIWCLGLGGLLATLIKEKNMMLPVAIFLAAFDIFLVLTPQGPTRKIMEQAPQVFESVAYNVPQVQVEATHAPVAAMAYIGPADFLFLGMFFIALYRYQMRVKQTFYWMVPTLIAYLLTVVVFGHLRIGGVSLAALPALVPIGGCVMLVNLREFDLSKDEKLSTALVALLAIGFIVWSVTR